MAEYADQLHEALRAEWEPEGFQHIRSFRWVERTPGPLRRIFEFQALGAGGHTRSARWGFGLDFVPVLRGRRFRWKRTLKSAEFDLCIDPVDTGDAGYYSFTYFQGHSEPLSKEFLHRVASQAARAARHDFARVVSMEDLIRLFEERARMKFKRFSLENYVQTHIAWELGLVSIGEQVDGEVHIRKFCDHFNVGWGDPLLLKAEAEACRYSAVALS